MKAISRWTHLYISIDVAKQIEVPKACFAKYGLLGLLCFHSRSIQRVYQYGYKTFKQKNQMKTKQQTAIEFYAMVDELNKKARELEQMGLKVDLRACRHSLSAYSEDSPRLECKVFEQTNY